MAVEPIIRGLSHRNLLPVRLEIRFLLGEQAEIYRRVKKATVERCPHPARSFDKLAGEARDGPARDDRLDIPGTDQPLTSNGKFHSAKVEHGNSQTKYRASEYS